MVSRHKCKEYHLSQSSVHCSGAYSTRTSRTCGRSATIFYRPKLQRTFVLFISFYTLCKYCDANDTNVPSDHHRTCLHICVNLHRTLYTKRVHRTWEFIGGRRRHAPLCPTIIFPYYRLRENITQKSREELKILSEVRCVWSLHFINLSTFIYFTFFLQYFLLVYPSMGELQMKK